MTLLQYKATILIATAVLGLVVASPALQRLLVLPQTEFFSEMSLLGPGRKVENYPFNLTQNVNYNVFLSVGNHLGRAAYYQIQVKLRNATQSAADIFTRTSSQMPALYNLNVFVADKETSEIPLTFSFDYSYDANSSQVNFNSLTLNSNVLNLTGYTISRDEIREGFFEFMFFELWIYNGSTGNFDYHERFTGLWLNMTSPA